MIKQNYTKKLKLEEILFNPVVFKIEQGKKRGKIMFKVNYSHSQNMKDNKLFRTKIDVRIEDSNKSFIVALTSCAYFKLNVRSIKDTKEVKDFFSKQGFAVTYPYVRGFLINFLSSVGGFKKFEIPLLLGAKI